MVYRVKITDVNYINCLVFYRLINKTLKHFNKLLVILESLQLISEQIKQKIHE